MASNDIIFAKEFIKMMHDMKANNINRFNITDISQIPLPEDLARNFIIERFNKVALSDIEEKYYSKLNNREVIYLKGEKLSKRKFDYKGNFMKDKKTGNIIREPVTCPSDCVAIASEISIGVPLKYKCKTGNFKYVDYAEQKEGNGVRRKYIYLIPKKYVYELNQTALVLSWNKQHKFYTSFAIALKTGDYLYVSVVPYNPKKETSFKYRVIHSKVDLDYSYEINRLVEFWISLGIAFDYRKCELIDVFSYRSREYTNMARIDYMGTMDVYEKLKTGRPLSEYNESNIMEESYDNYNQ